MKRRTAAMIVILALAALVLYQRRERARPHSRPPNTAPAAASRRPLPRPAPAPAARALDRAEPASVGSPAAPAAAPADTASSLPVDVGAVGDATRRFIADLQDASLDHPASRATWLQALADDEGLAPDEAAALAAALEDEFAERAAIIAEARSGARPRAEAKAALAALGATASERTRAVLTPAHHAAYLARRRAAGLPTGEPEPQFLTMFN